MSGKAVRRMIGNRVRDPWLCKRDAQGPTIGTGRGVSCRARLDAPAKPEFDGRKAASEVFVACSHIATVTSDTINESYKDQEVADNKIDGGLDVGGYPSDETRWDGICRVNDTDDTREDTRREHGQNHGSLIRRNAETP